MQLKCKAKRKDGAPCQSWAVGASGYCTMHNPARRDTNRETQRKGGEARSAARRAVRQWASIGEQVSAGQLPAMLRACMVSVKAGTMEPAQASAIATLAKTSVSITNEIELERRIAALEEAAGLKQESGALRRVK